MIHIVLLALLPIFFVLLLGYSAGKWRIVDHAHVGALNTVVMNYALPASLFAATAATPRQAMLAQWSLLVSLGVTMMLIHPLWYLLQRRLQRRSIGESAVQALTVALPNYAAAGLPIAAALLGQDHLVPVAVAIAAGALLPSPVTLALLELAGADAAASKGGIALRIARAIGRALRRPLVLAPIIGTALSLLAWPLPDVAAASLRQIGTAAGGLALFVTGLILSAQRFRLSANTLLAVATINFARPLLALLVAHLLGTPVEVTHIVVLMAALPAGFFGILFGKSFGVNSEEAGAIIIASTVLSMLTLALVIGWLYG